MPADGSQNAVHGSSVARSTARDAKSPSLAEQFTAKGYVETDGVWADPAKPHLPGFVIGGPDPFTAEDWARYDDDRPERCSPDLIRRAAQRVVRNRDGF